MTPPWYICIKYSCRCKTVIFLDDVTGASVRADVGPLLHSVACKWVCVGACGCSQWKCRLLKHGDELLIAPTSSTQPSTLCITWQFASPLFRLFNFSLSPTMSLLGVTVCLFVSVETFCFLFGGETFVVFVLFLFCKAYDSYCIRASSNNKNSKKLLLFLLFVFHTLLSWVCQKKRIVSKHTATANR